MGNYQFIGSVLVVDDNALSRNSLAKLLEGQGYTVTVAENGTIMLGLIEKQLFDLVLLDVMMPGLNGLEVLKALRVNHSMADLPVIMVTGMDDSQDIVDALQLGANDYVTKPLDLPVILARIQTQLALKNAMNKNKELEQSLSRRNEELEVVNLSMKRDLDAAAEIQKALLPAQLPDIPDASFAWIFKPCAELGGDILNIFQLDDRHVGLYVLDVVGHGVAASLLSVTLSRFLSPFPGPSAILWQRQEGLPGYRLLSPAKVAEQLNQRFCQDRTTDQYFTLLYGILDLETWEFRFVSAGHPGPVYLEQGGQAVGILHKPGWPIGVGPTSYQEQTLALKPGDRLFLYSDGITEAFNSTQEQFGVERFLSETSQYRGLPLQENLERLYQSVEKWTGKTHAHDDATLVALERKMPTKSWRVSPRKDEMKNKKKSTRKGLTATL